MSDSPFLALGEVHTALLHSSRPLPLAAAGHLVEVSGGAPVQILHRPIMHVASPETLTGVDCRLPTLSGARARGVGTVAGRASITGGHVVQGSARARLVVSPERRRLGWSHYLARPGRVDLIGKGDGPDLAAGFAREGGDPEALDQSLLDLGSIGARLVDGVQRSRALDHRAPLRAARTRLRWVALPAAEPDAIGASFAIERRGLRTLRVWCDPADLEAVGDFCDDVALHDWLLTTLLHLVEDGRNGAPDDRALIARLRPAVEHLLHLWMPQARLGPELARLWDSLEGRPGMARQWRSCVDRIRDQLALSTLGLFGR